MRNAWCMTAAALGGLCLLALSHADGNSAESVIRHATGEIYSALEDQCEVVAMHPEYLYKLVDTIVLPHADTRRMSQWVLGKHWRDLDGVQRDVFVQEFRLLLTRTYATAIQLASLDEIDYLPRRDSSRPDRATVRAEIRRPGEPLVFLAYSLFKRDEEWLVYDILVDGVSLVSNYRASFADEIRSRGFAGLIASMKTKNQQPMSASTAEQVRRRSARTCDMKTGHTTSGRPVKRR